MDGAALRRPENGCTKRRAVIGCGGLNKNVIKHAGLQKLAVGGTVEGNATRQRYPPQTGAFSEFSAEMEHDAIETLLKGGSHIAVIASDFGIGIARPDQMLRKVL